jgi:predicted SprT family Zn-dependent metalloprotease
MSTKCTLAFVQSVKPYKKPYSCFCELHIYREAGTDEHYVSIESGKQYFCMKVNTKFAKKLARMVEAGQKMVKTLGGDE